MKPTIRSLALASLATSLALFAACASTTTAKPDPVDPNIAERPYTAKQIQGAMPVGTKIWMEKDVEGKVTLEEWEVTAADDDTCTMSRKVVDKDGKVLEDQGSKSFTWVELRDHAAFPVNTTQRFDGSVAVPAGKYESWMYIVNDIDDKGLPVVTYYHFAKTLPGPPVMMTKVVDGKTVLKMMMTGRR